MSGPRSSRPVDSFATLVCIVLGWGVLVFGSVYPWAYTPLFCGAAAIGVLGLARPRTPLRINRPLVAATVLVGVAIGLQLMPVPAMTLAAVSPRTEILMRQYDVLHPALLPQRHSDVVSIKSSATFIALLCYAALALFAFGVSVRLSDRAATRVSRFLIVVGAFIGVAGVIQRAAQTPKLYGFFTTQIPRVFTAEGGPFGPFPNRNHFAGWMLMAIPMGVAYIARTMGEARPELARRQHMAAWLGSEAASRIALSAFGVVVMTAALLLTVSRSGIGAFFIQAAVAAVVVWRSGSRAAKIGGAAYLSLMVIGAAAWTSPTEIAKRFDAARVDISVRERAWSDALRIAADFPAVGTGINTYGVATLFYEPPTLTVHYVQAHNDYLQLAAEGGLLVTVPAAILVVAIGVTIWRRFADERAQGRRSPARAGALFGLAGIALQELFDFSLQMPGNTILFVFLIAVAVRPVSARA
jgi:O-antigen ligase